MMQRTPLSILGLVILIGLVSLIGPSSLNPPQASCPGDYCEAKEFAERKCVGTPVCGSRQGTYHYHRCFLCGRNVIAVHVVCC